MLNLKKFVKREEYSEEKKRFIFLGLVTLVLFGVIWLALFNTANIYTWR